jgi:MFS family permease
MAPERPTAPMQRVSVKYTLVVLVAINLLNFYDRAIFGAVAEPIRKQWALSDAQLGWLATAFTLLYAVIGVPMGRLADTRRRSRVLAYGVAAWSVLTAVSGLAWNFISMFLARLGVGVGEAACAPAGNALIGDLYPAAKRGRALGIFMLGLPLGYSLGSYVSGWVASSYGWRMAFFVACIPGLIAAVLAYRMSDPPRGAAEAAPVVHEDRSGSPYWSVLRIPTIAWIIATGALFNFNSYAYVTFLPAYLSRYHGQNLRQANTEFAIVWGGAGIVGILFGGWIADHISHRSKSGRLVVGGVALLLSAAGAYLALNLRPGQILPFVMILGAGVTLAYLYYPCVYSAIQDVVRPDLRGTAMALYFFAMYLLGGSFGPVVVGRLSDRFARIAASGGPLTESARATGLHSALYAVVVLSILVAVALFGAATTVAGDMGKLQRGIAAQQKPMSAESAV